MFRMLVTGRKSNSDITDGYTYLRVPPSPTTMRRSFARLVATHMRFGLLTARAGQTRSIRRLRLGPLNAAWVVMLQSYEDHKVPE